MNLNELLNYSLDSGASDLHLSVGSVPMVRINGTMKPLNVDVLKQSEMKKMLPQVMNEDQQKLFKETFIITGIRPDFYVVCLISVGS